MNNDLGGRGCALGSVLSGGAGNRTGHFGSASAPAHGCLRNGLARALDTANQSFLERLQVPVTPLSTQGTAYTHRRVTRVVERTIDRRGQTMLVPVLEIEGW
jgi:hypothetical protein